MAHWSVTDEPSPVAPTAEPAPRSPIERIAEILEVLFLRERELTAELLVELGRADTATLAKLFGSPSAAAEMPRGVAMARVETPAAEPAGPGGVWSKPGVEPIEPNPEQPKWDERGYRISPPHRSVFPRQDPYRSGTHWSR